MDGDNVRSSYEIMDFSSIEGGIKFILSNNDVVNGGDNDDNDDDDIDITAA